MGKNNAEKNYETFSEALRKVLAVPHSQMKAMLESEQQRKPKRASASRVSPAKKD